MTTLLERTIAQNDRGSNDPRCFACEAIWTRTPSRGLEIRHEPTCVYLELLALGDTDDDPADGLYVFAKCLKATLIAIYEEWASLGFPNVDTWGNFLAGWIYECAWKDSDGYQVGFIHPKVSTRPGAFGNHWGL